MAACYRPCSGEFLVGAGGEFSAFVAGEVEVGGRGVHAVAPVPGKGDAVCAAFGRERAEDLRGGFSFLPEKITRA